MSHSDEFGPDDGLPRLRKSPTAFRTISEVAEDLHIPQHVLRFWETKFPQVRPLKRGGGRRYYRPDDIALLRRIAELLYVQGYTIKGVQRLLHESGGQLANAIPAPGAGECAESEPEEDIHDPEPDHPPARSAEADRLRSLLIQTLRDLEQLRADLIASAATSC